MSKYAWISAGLSLLIVFLLPLHYYLVSLLGAQEYLNMGFGLMIGVALAFNIDIIVHKLRPQSPKPSRLDQHE